MCNVLRLYLTNGASIWLWYSPFILNDYIIAIGGVITLYIISKRIERCKFRYILNLISWIGTNSLVILCAHTFENNLSLFPDFGNASPLKSLFCKCLIISMGN